MKNNGMLERRVLMV